LIARNVLQQLSVSETSNSTPRRVGSIGTPNRHADSRQNRHCQKNTDENVMPLFRVQLKPNSITLAGLEPAPN